MNIDFSYYLSVFLRRLHIFLILAAGVTAAGVYVATILPASYSASARLLVESPQIPTNLAASTVSTQADEQLSILQQRLLTRANLLEIAREFKVFEGSERLSPDEIVSRMRSQTSLRLRGRIMNIEFRSENARTAAAVANEYVTRILEETAEIRKGLAGNTQQFFDDEVNRLSAELDRRGAMIAEFKGNNSQALPDSLNFRLNRQSDQQERLTQINRELQTLNEQRTSLVELYDSGGQLQVDERSLSPEERQLRSLQDQLENALAVYSPSNPRVRILQTRVSRLEQQVSEAAAEGEGEEDPRDTLYNMQLAQIDARIDLLSQQKNIIDADLQRLEDSIAATPQNATVLEAMERDYQNIRSQYNAAVGRLATAATGERIELLSKGERITVLEQATVPGSPTSPDRMKIAGAGGVAGIGLGAAAVVLLELLNTSIRRPVDLQKGLGITPLITLPYIRTRRELIFKRAVVIFLLVAVVVGAPAFLYAVHTFYLPLDLIFDRLAAKIMP